MANKAQLFATLFFIIYVLICIALIILYLGFEAFTGTTSWHGLFMLAGIMCMGIALFMYRLLRGLRTRAVKYIHFLFHTIALILFIVGCVFCDGHVSQPTKIGDQAHLATTAHFWVGYHFLGCFLFQYILALFLFIYLYENKKRRLYFAPFHDIFGIWMFLCVAGTYLTGVYYQYESLAGYKSDDMPFTLEILLIPSYLLFLVVLGTVLSPYLEWELVGAL